MTQPGDPQAWLAVAWDTSMCHSHEDRATWAKLGPRGLAGRTPAPLWQDDAGRGDPGPEEGPVPLTPHPEGLGPHSHHQPSAPSQGPTCRFGGTCRQP